MIQAFETGQIQVAIQIHLKLFRCSKLCLTTNRFQLKLRSDFSMSVSSSAAVRRPGLSQKIKDGYDGTFFTAVNCNLFN